LDDAIQVLADADGGATVLAGGQTLVALMNLRLAQPSILVDISHLQDLAAIDVTDDALRVGAAVTQAQLEDHAETSTVPLLADVLPHIAHREIRNAGTVVGNLAHGDPASEIPMVAVLVGASFTVLGPSGERSVAASEMYTGYLETSISHNELITHVSFPRSRTRPGSTTWGFSEHATRHGDYAIAGSGAVLDVEAGVIITADVGGIAVGTTPVRTSAGGLLVGQNIDWVDLAAFRNAAMDSVDPKDDVHATADYRRHLFGVAAQRAVEQAVERHRTVGAA